MGKPYRKYPTDPPGNVRLIVFVVVLLLLSIYLAGR